MQIADNRFQISECRRGLGVHQGQMTENRKQKSGMPVQISKWWRLHISDVKAAHQDLLQITEWLELRRLPQFKIRSDRRWFLEHCKPYIHNVDDTTYT